MDMATNLIFLVIFGLIGFVISKIWGINPYRIFSDIGTVVIMVPLMFFVINASLNPENALNLIEPMVDFFVNNLPGIMIGDIAGSLIAEITGEKI
jgi:hypothetical protein